MVDSRVGYFDEFLGFYGLACVVTEQTSCRTVGTVQNEDYIDE